MNTTTIYYIPVGVGFDGDRVSGKKESAGRGGVEFEPQTGQETVFFSKCRSKSSRAKKDTSQYSMMETNKEVVISENFYRSRRIVLRMEVLKLSSNNSYTLN